MNPAEAEATRLQSRNDQLETGLRNLTHAAREASASLTRINTALDEMGAGLRRLGQNLNQNLTAGDEQ